MARKAYVAIPGKLLKTDITSSDSTFKIRDILWYTGSDGVDVNLAASDFGSDNVGYGVFEPRTDREEWFTFSSANMAVATTTGLTISARGLIRTSPYTTEASARKFSHSSGTTVLLYTNAPAFYDGFAHKANDETITGLFTFPTGANYPVVGTVYSAPTSDLQVATKKYVDNVSIAGASDASTTARGIVEIATGAELAAGTGTGGTGAVIVPAGSSFTNTSAGAGDANKIPVLNGSGIIADGFLDAARTWATTQQFNAATIALITPPGIIAPYGGASAPTGWLLCDGSAVSRSTYSSLFAIVAPTIGTVTVTIAAPGVMTKTTHGLATGDALYLTTTGALPTGLSANTRYWITKIDANTFKLATSLANALAATNITTTGSQSGTHTATQCPYGVGNGSTTFNLPSLSGVLAVGKDQTNSAVAGLGQTGGAGTTTLTTTQLPAHTHTMGSARAVSGGAQNLGYATVGYDGTGDLTLSGVTGSAGTGSAFSILNPYLALNFIIKT